MREESLVDGFVSHPQVTMSLSFLEVFNHIDISKKVKTYLLSGGGNTREET
jgi:hypothetical protein